MINDYTLKTDQPASERIEIFANSTAINVAGEFTYGARIIRRQADGSFVYEKYRGGYTKVHPDYYLVDSTLRHAKVVITDGDIALFDEALRAYETKPESIVSA